QVYQLATALGVPAGVTDRPPTTDTYSLPQSQEEFYFALPALTMDLLLYALNAGMSAAEAAGALGLREDQAAPAYLDIERKHSTMHQQHVDSLLERPVRKIDAHGAGATV